MIPPIHLPWQPHIWREELANAYRKPDDLLKDLGIASVDPPYNDAFSTLVPRGFAARMTPGNLQDPLLKQVLPNRQESQLVAGFSKDPLAETDLQHGFNSTPGLIHKYQGRVLLITTPACAVHCRYCFRRHFPYEENRPKHLEQALAAIEHDASINEVILSGGDPLLLDDSALADLFKRLQNIQHLQRLRIHTRLPVVLPQRITQLLLDTLSGCKLDTVLVIHCNHPNELDQDTQRALACLHQTRTWLFNQAVLLKDINDNVEVQVDLAMKLFAQQVLPYYLHLPDAVQGTHHFFIDRTRGLAIFAQMQAKLPGYLLPRLVQEQPGEASKLIVSTK